MGPSVSATFGASTRKAGLPDRRNDRRTHPTMIVQMALADPTHGYATMTDTV